IDVGVPMRDPAGVGHTSAALPSARALVGRLAAAFVVACTGSTLLLLTQFAARTAGGVAAIGTQWATTQEQVRYAIPFTLALTVPLSVLVAVLWVFTTLGRTGLLDAVSASRTAARRLAVPVMAGAAAVAMLYYPLVTELVPRANAHLEQLRSNSARPVGERSMTLDALRAAVAAEQQTASAHSPVRIASYEVEIHKKFALSAASVVFALVGMAVTFRWPRGGRPLAITASAALVVGYYVCATVAEEVADRGTLSPMVAMWAANAAVLLVAIMLTWAGGGRPRADAWARA
ncbi:MAG: LptF/LptG family permease, partial [Gemmatimonadaceae bacterium]|nr:LptF/LptG family permease [Gemmatimonadaceae bacterium]